MINAQDQREGNTNRSQLKVIVVLSDHKYGELYVDHASQLRSTFKPFEKDSMVVQLHFFFFFFYFFFFFHTTNPKNKINYQQQQTSPKSVHPNIRLPTKYKTKNTSALNTNRKQNIITHHLLCCLLLAWKN
eukprot:TRINITY_DN4109_c0_g1_i3.p7 TRINITY_DN4109_c0_g1~~TRINITY_DN4109_c0_g1_i3.p7  ORF type:complete len:131 (-),score=6.41 TRINITY_DN4109_c0_g1_i3:941-1333(-)